MSYINLEALDKSKSDWFNYKKVKQDGADYRGKRSVVEIDIRQPWSMNGYREVRFLSILQLLILNIINMIKLKRLSVEKIDPSINQKGQIEFSFNDCYLCKNQIGGVVIINNKYSIIGNWAQKEIVKYCMSNNLQLCTIYTIDNMPDYNNIVVDETVKELLKSL